MKILIVALSLFLALVLASSLAFAHGGGCRKSSPPDGQQYWNSSLSLSISKCPINIRALTVLIVGID